MPHSGWGGSLQDPERINAVFQLPEIWPYLNKLQATTPMHVAWRRPPSQGMPRIG
jgi:hypothetical protein